MAEFIIFPKMDDHDEVEGEPTIVVADGAGDYSVEGDASRGERVVTHLRSYEEDFKDMVPYERRIKFYRDLNIEGFEGSFVKNFGSSSKNFWMNFTIPFSS